ncbi:hypothetical protein ABEB36_001077 [Hypothenemus hampei]|uniref:non-specific serine/threonine protein kinase n=1 Tax=Hypothenemus hampei TaxID=57062 RepID=A0ABD1FE91_HYPHA
MTSQKPIYIHELPYEIKQRLCNILDQENKWEELGKRMHYDEAALQNIKAKGRTSPSNQLLYSWGNLNHDVAELFMLLNDMGLYNAMATLRSLLDPKYHVLIKENNVLNQLNQLQIDDSKILPININKNTVKNLRKASDSVQTTDNNITYNSNENLLFHIRSTAGLTPQIPYEELTEATDSWSPHRLLGQGGFATVFRGNWKCTQVAIKRLEHSKSDVIEPYQQSLRELHCLNAYKHDNVLPLYGYSIDGDHQCLVYQYMAGGSLDKRIRTKDNSRIMSWPTRLNIAIGTARGLQFLHTTLRGDKPLIHGDIKSANILLDLMDQPKIGDFGLSREGPGKDKTHILVSRAHGTRPYAPEEFLRSKQFSTKIDTYSFGVVLFELATGYPPMVKHNKPLKDHVVNYPEEHVINLKDVRCEGGDVIFMKFYEIGKMCVAKRANDRPEMVNVFCMLENVKLMSYAPSL